MSEIGKTIFWFVGVIVTLLVMLPPAVALFVMWVKYIGHLFNL